MSEKNIKLSKKKDGRCKTLTQKGERCKNLAFLNGRCKLHAAQNKLSEKRKGPSVTTVISSSVSLVILIEKLVKYWPDILYTLEYLIAMVSDASWRGENTPDANRARLDALKSATVVGSFHNLKRILEESSEGKASRFSHLKRDLPPGLSDKLEEAIKNHTSNLESLRNEQGEIENLIFHECSQFLNRFIEKWNWLYENYRFYEFNSMVEDIYALTEEHVFEWRKSSLERFEREYPQEYKSFLERHQKFKHLTFLTDYINFLHFLKNATTYSMDSSVLDNIKLKIKPHLKNHLNEEDLAELDLVHERLCLYWGQLWSLQDS